MYQKLTPKQKALTINLDPTIYGTFAEIGAGQETVRHFFRAGELPVRLLKQCLHTTKILVMPSTEKK